MRIAQVDVEGLFNLFSYKIPLRLDEHITIIHGPNGCGKTTVLRILQCLFGKRIHELSRTHFKLLRVTFDGGTVLSVTRILREGVAKQSRPKRNIRRMLPPEESLIETAELEFKVSKDANAHGPWTFIGSVSGAELPFPIEIIESQLPFLTRVDEFLWQHDHSGELLGVDEIIARFPERLPFMRPASGQETPKWLAELFDGIEVHFIQTQRLLRLSVPNRSDSGRRRTHRAMVLEFSEDLVERIRTTLAQSVQQARALDQSFPIRVLSQRPRNKVTAIQISERYEQQQAKQKRLIAAGLMGEQNEADLPYNDLEEVGLQLLWMYLDDTEKKIAVFDEFLGKIEVLTDMINSRFLHKRLQIDREAGFLFKGGDDRAIPLDALSSGEQHELVLTYELLFRVKAGSLILVDEPELSLHVGWQHRFLEDLKRISNLASLDFLVATHSPQIIHKRWDLTVALADDL